MNDGTVYGYDYYIRGRESGLSLYQDYRWIPSLTIPFCRRIAEVCSIHEDDTILDFGCARGYVVKAFRELGYRAFGVDVSEWAIENCDPDVREFVQQSKPGQRPALKAYDWIVAKDVLEHIRDPELASTIDNLTENARKGVFVVVPLASGTGEGYVVPEYEQDVTHCQRLTLGQWITRLARPGVCVCGCYLVPGIKDNYSQWEKGNGFIWIRPGDPEWDAL